VTTKKKIMKSLGGIKKVALLPKGEFHNLKTLQKQDSSNLMGEPREKCYTQNLVLSLSDVSVKGNRLLKGNKYDSD